MCIEMLFHNLGALECPLRQQTPGVSHPALCLSRVLANPALPGPPLPSPLPGGAQHQPLGQSEVGRTTPGVCDPSRATHSCKG